MPSIDLLLHPIRIRIIQALLDVKVDVRLFDTTEFGCPTPNGGTEARSACFECSADRADGSWPRLEFEARWRDGFAGAGIWTL